MRVAVVDLGTNSTRLLVADVDGTRVDEVARELHITRLGEGVDERHRLLPVAIARVRNVLTGYRREAKRLGAERVLTLGTSSVRDAENGEAFLGEIEWSYGFTTRLLSGEDEAALAYAGVSAGREVNDDTMVVDIGGGSTELITGSNGEVGFRVSVDIGSVRLTERCLDSDPPTATELDACAAVARAALAAQLPAGIRPRSAIGVAGTITTLAALDLGLAEHESERVHGHLLSAAGVDEQLERLAGMPLAERRLVPALDPERAPVIVAGAIVLREVLAQAGLDEIEASERDLLHGAAVEAAALPEPVEGDAPPGAFTCC